MTETTELVIVDGASNDNTHEVVTTYTSEHANVRYIRLDSNGGFDQDYSRTVEFARGDYCWLMSDDDLLKPGAIHAVLEAIKDKYDLIVVNAELRNSDLSELVEERRLRIHEDRIYRPNDKDEMLAELGTYMSFIGCVVIRRDVWCNREKQRYFGTMFVHVGVIFQEPLREHVLVIAEPWIIIRYGNANWVGQSFEIWMFKWPNLIQSLPYGADARNSVAPSSPNFVLKQLLVHRAQGQYSLEHYQQLEKVKGNFGWRFKASANLIARLPMFPVNLMITLLYKIWRRGQRQTVLYDLATARREKSQRFHG